MKYFDIAVALIAEQFPQYQSLPIIEPEIQGHDNRSFFVGKDLVLRLPSASGYVPQVLKEQQWLPELSPQLPCAIPQPAHLGQPSPIFPWPWSIYHFIPGTPLSRSTITLSQKEIFAHDLAIFLKKLHSIDASDGPLAGAHNYYRGAHPQHYHDEAMQSFALLKYHHWVKRAQEIWQQARLSQWESNPVWVHGDIAPGNILIHRGSLNAVIDFGCVGVGDPSCDLVIAWTYFSGSSRDIFQKTLGYDKDTWLRAQAWALWKACLQLLPWKEDLQAAQAQEPLRVIQDICARDEG